MNSRERFLATMNFKPVDHAPLIEWDYWIDTWEVWRAQGAPISDRGELGVNKPEDENKKGSWDPFTTIIGPSIPFENNAKVNFAMETGLRRVPLNSFISPKFEHKIIEERNGVIISQDERGMIREDKKGQETLWNILANPVQDWESWEKIKAERLALNMKGRLPKNWQQIKNEFKNRDYPLAIGGHSALCGFFHPLRYLIGPETLLMGFYDMPDLIKAMMDHLADLQIYLFDQILNEIDVDLGFACEDLGYKAGPFISPELFREFVKPCYIRLTSMLRDHGVKIMFVDNDGNITKLIPDFMEAGVTAMGPMEVAAGMDVVNVREMFPTFQIMGGIDKRQIAKGKQAIDKELDCKLPKMLKIGGYIPTIDHGVPPDISWENFCYYRQRVGEIARSCGTQ